jgi:hypothetical protein
MVASPSVVESGVLRRDSSFMALRALSDRGVELFEIEATATDPPRDVSRPPGP